MSRKLVRLGVFARSFPGRNNNAGLQRRTAKSAAQAPRTIPLPPPDVASSVKLKPRPDAGDDPFGSAAGASKPDKSTPKRRE